MTRGTPYRTSVPLSRLQLGDQLAEGGFGRVTAVVAHPLGPRPNGLPSGELVYKEFKPGLPAHDLRSSVHSATAAVHWRAALPDPDARALDDVAAWPVAVVTTSRNTVCGCLMPRLPPEFFYQVPLLSGGGRRDRTLADLCRPHTAARKMGHDPGEWDLGVRTSVVAGLARAVATLHRLGLVYGDLSGRNVVFAQAPPRVLLLDCDSAAHVQDTTRRQGHTPFWVPPEHRKDPGLRQDQRSDVHKLALAVVRGLESGPGATQLTALTDRHRTALGPDTIALLELALGADPDARPTARRLAHLVDRDARQLAAPPVITAAALSRRRGLRGQGLEVAWTVHSRAPLTALRVRVPGETGTADVIDVHPPTADRCSFPLRGTGTVVVEAANRYGSTAHVLGMVECVELPPFDLSLARLPRTEVPHLPRFTPPEVLARPTAVPRVTVPAPPRLAPPDTTGLLTRLQRVRATAPGVRAGFPARGHGDGDGTRHDLPSATAELLRALADAARTTPRPPADGRSTS